jgi:transposase
LALAAIYDGAKRVEAARIGGVTLQIVRGWVLKFNAQGPSVLIDRKAPGQKPRLNDARRAALAKAIDDGPIPAIHGVVHWRLVDLCQWAFEEFRVSVSPQTMSREARALGYRKLSARPRHRAQAAGAIEDQKKPRSPAQRIASTGIFGAICPKEGGGAKAVLPLCNTKACRERADREASPTAATIAYVPF